MAYWHDRPATSAAPRYIALLYLLTALLRVTYALQSVSGSPCDSVCADAGTLEDDVVCLDASYQSLDSGRAFQKCVACQLNSTAVDPANNDTDVGWGLRKTPSFTAGNDRGAEQIFQWPFDILWRGVCLPSRKTTSPSAALVKSAVHS